jgi:hypothetical protein
MKNIKSSIHNIIISNITFNLVLINLFMFINLSSLLAVPPVPPGVPLDGGVSLLAAVAIAYGVKTMSKEKETF